MSKIKVNIRNAKVSVCRTTVLRQQSLYSFQHITKEVSLKQANMQAHRFLKMRSSNPKHIGIHQLRRDNRPAVSGLCLIVHERQKMKYFVSFLHWDTLNVANMHVVDCSSEQCIIVGRSHN